MYAKKKYSTVDEFERVLVILARKDYICAMCAQVYVFVHPSVRACVLEYLYIYITLYTLYTACDTLSVNNSKYNNFIIWTSILPTKSEKCSQVYSF